MKDDIKSIISNIGESSKIVIEPAKQRMANPIMGSFILTFIALNWRPITFLFLSDKSIEEKLKFFDKNFYGDKWYGWHDYSMYLIFPILITVTYVILIPIAIEWIDKVIQHTTVNRLRRENIINYKRHRGQESIAWAQYKTEEARTGFEDRNKLNKDLERFKNELNDEKESNNILSENNLKQTEQINLLGNKIKELELERDSLKRDADSLNKTITSNNKMILDLQESVDNVSNQNASHMNDISFKNQQLDEVNLKNNDLQNNVSLLSSQNTQLREDINTLSNELNNLKDSYNNLFIGNSDLQNRYNLIESERIHLNERVSLLNEFEGNFYSIQQTLIDIQDRMDLTEKQDFYNINNISDLVNKTLKLINIVNTLDLNQLRVKTSFYLQLYKRDEISVEILINSLYTNSESYNVIITKIEIIDSTQIGLILSSHYEPSVTEFINSFHHLTNNYTMRKMAN